MDITTAIKHAIDGNAILFLGAGFSIGGKNKKNQDLPTANELSEQMCEELGIGLSHELAIVSERFISDKKVGKGIDELLYFLHERIFCVSTTEEQDTIIKLPWMRIYTTNYDNIVELSSRKQGKEREVITATLPKKSISSSLGAVVHMNGNIVTVNSNNFYEEFKITNENYLRAGFLSSAWGDQFISDINNCKAIIFIGYSLKYDLELQKVMHECIADKAIFIDREETNENQRYVFEKWGNFYPIEANGFSDAILQVEKEYQATPLGRKMRGIEEIEISKFKNSNILPNDVLNMFIYGKCDKYEFRNTKDFYLKRKEVLEAVTGVLKKKKICILHSNLGNGKSIAILYLAAQLIERFRVYIVNDTNTIQDDLEIIKSRKSQEHIIFVDDYDQHMPILKELSYDFPDNVRIVATCRTSISEVMLDHLESDFGYSYEEIGVVNIEIITDDERKELINIFDAYNFWGNKSTLSNKQKNDLICNKYRNRLSSVFYMLLDSNVISDKLAIIFEELKSEEVRKYLLSQSICDICNFKLRGYEIARLANIDFSEIEKASLSKGSKEIFMRTNNDIEIRSTIFSQYLIKENKDYKKISRILVDIYINTVRSGRQDYVVISKKLISRSNLIEVFGGRRRNSEWKNRDRDIYDFYSSIQNYSKENPFFWLQYAITALNLGYHFDAKLYFENAYTYAAELESFDFFQLDTHFARFLLEEMVRYDTAFDFDKMTKAHMLLMNNSNAEVRLSYVLRQVGIYYEVSKRFDNQFSAENRLEFVQYIKDVIKKYEEYFSAIERKKNDTFFFAVDKSVRPAYKNFRKLLLEVIPRSELLELDLRYNKLVNRNDRVYLKRK